MDMFMPKQTSMSPVLMPTLLPQISDPRIVIQTFNAPNAPILPNVLPKPKIEMNIKLPELNNPPPSIIQNEIVRNPRGRVYEKMLKRDIENAFIGALRKSQSKSMRHGMLHGSFVANRDHHPEKFNIYMSHTERRLHQIEESEKMEKILERITKFSSDYELFSDIIKLKSKVLANELSKQKRVNVRIIV